MITKEQYSNYYEATTRGTYPNHPEGREIRSICYHCSSFIMKIEQSYSIVKKFPGTTGGVGAKEIIFHVNCFVKIASEEWLME